MENLKWKEKVDGQDDILAEDINAIAKYANKLNGGKVDKEDGKALSTNDYTDADKNTVNSFSTFASDINTKLSIIEEPKNILPKDVEIISGYVNCSTGVFKTYTDSNSYKYYGLINTKIPVKGGANITISYTNASGNRANKGINALAFYDENEVFISALGKGTDYYTESVIFNTTTTYVTTPENARYIAFSYYTNGTYTDYTEFQVEYGENKTAYEEPQKVYISTDAIKVDEILNSGNPFYGKNWCAIGDSITIRSGNYVGILADELGMNATNLGISGAGCKQMRRSFSDPTYTTGTVPYSEERENAVINADLITIYGCINDWFKSTDTATAYAIGDLYGERTTNTFINMFKDLIEAILERNPTATIVIIGTHNAWDSSRPDIYQPVRDTDTVAEYVDAMNKVARYYGLYFIDMYHESGINSYTGDTYLSDRVHPNAMGYARISNVIKKHLLSNVAFTEV